MRLLIVLIFFSNSAIAQVIGAPSCPRLEGVTLPICKSPAANQCHSGVFETCEYVKTVQVFKRPKVDGGEVKCPGEWITDPCPPGKEGCNNQPYCNEPTITVVTCNATCDLCYPHGDEIDLGVMCYKFCGQPSRCPGQVDGYRRKPNNECPATPPTCADLKPTDPKIEWHDNGDALVCPPPPPPSSGSANFDPKVCCSTKGSNPYGLQPCAGFPEPTE